MLFFSSPVRCPCYVLSHGSETRFVRSVSFLSMSSGWSVRGKKDENGLSSLRGRDLEQVAASGGHYTSTAKDDHSKRLLRQWTKVIETSCLG